MTKLYPNLQAKVQVLIENAHKKGLDVWIVQGMRTIEQQNELYEQGRTKGKKGKTVTNAKGGESYHNYGLAVDVVFHGSEPYGESHNWKALGEAGKEAGLEWGGGWKSFPDRPHFQISGLKLSQLKSWYADGGMENVWKNISA
jgi:peptidoglycan L-alanyl-D-glutamate endopeptidase CwlK